MQLELGNAAGSAWWSWVTEMAGNVQKEVKLKEESWVSDYATTQRSLWDVWYNNNTSFYLQVNSMLQHQLNKGEKFPEIHSMLQFCLPFTK